MTVAQQPARPDRPQEPAQQPGDGSAGRSSASGGGGAAGERPYDAALMGLALAEAERGRGRTSPNPLVGAVVVDEGDGTREPVVLARGFHARAGADHAEVAALRALAAIDASASTGPLVDTIKGCAPGKSLYVTLEPCNHIGRTGKCTDAILAAGIRRVVVGMRDPNPRVAGGGIERLREAGVEVTVGVEEPQCRRQNRGYLCWLASGRPHVILKAAISLDGRLAPAGPQGPPGPGGEAAPRWLTGAEARLRAHVLRDEVDAILVGAGTVLADDPRLSVRLPAGHPRRAMATERQPLRVILDGALRLPETARLCGPGTLLFTSEVAATERAGHAQALRARGVEVVALPPFRPRSIEILHRPLRPTDISPYEVLARLGERGVLTLLCEGGAELHAVLLELGLYGEAALFVAPILLGDSGVPLLAGYPVTSVGAAPWLDEVSIETLGRDLLMRGALRLGGYAPTRPAPGGG